MEWTSMGRFVLLESFMLVGLFYHKNNNDYLF
jgi:hypothetical protein